MTKPGSMIEIRWHGRGGQGAKTAAILTAEVALEEGKYSQGFPDYGPERMGAPMRGYTRISDSPIRLHCSIDAPDVVVVLDATLMDTVDVCDGVPEQGTVVINSNLSPDELRSRFAIEGRKIYTIDATQIAINNIGRAIPNMPMIGALAKATGILDLEAIKKDVIKKFQGKFSQKIIDGNLKALQQAYEEVKSE